MKYIAYLFALIVLACVATAYWIDQDSYSNYLDDQGDMRLDALNGAKRKRGGVCMKWGFVCVPDSRLKFTKCCRGLNCVCNIWSTHCRCRAKLG